MGQLKYEPRNEMAVREWISSHLDELGYSIIKSGSACPDYILEEDKTGEPIRAEVEYQNSNFIAHNHDPSSCDLILCWIHDGILPLPVRELSTDRWYETGQEPEGEIRRVVKKDKGPNKTLVKKTLSAKPELVDTYMEALIADMKIRSRHHQEIRDPRLKLLAATNLIIRHLRQEGVQIKDMHPDDLLFLVS